MSTVNGRIAVIVSEIFKINELITRFSFVCSDRGQLPAFSGGAHIIIEMNDAGTLRRNPYSLMSNPYTQDQYSVSIRRDDEGRGGSVYMHTQVTVGRQMFISNPVNLFALDLRATKHLMIAGGIGITPFMSQILQLQQLNKNFELHYSVRSISLSAYTEKLADEYTDSVHVYDNERGQALDLTAILSNQPLGTHLYICGPKGMINWVLQQAINSGWPRLVIHFKEFSIPSSGERFSVTLAKSALEIEVTEHQSLLEALENAGIDAPYLCRGGACGQCETKVISHQGSLLHNDHWLDDNERQQNKKIMPCVSRFKGQSLILDL